MLTKTHLLQSILTKLRDLFSCNLLLGPHLDGIITCKPISDSHISPAITRLLLAMQITAMDVHTHNLSMQLAPTRKEEITKSLDVSSAKIAREGT